MIVSPIKLPSTVSLINNCNSAALVPVDKIVLARPFSKVNCVDLIFASHHRTPIVIGISHVSTTVPSARSTEKLTGTS